MKYILALVVCLLTFVLSLSPVQAKQPIGYVEKLDGPGSAFRLYRDGEKQLIAPMTDLYVGDRIEIFPEKCKKDDTFNDTCTLTFNLCDQQRVHVESSQSPYIIPEDFVCQSSSWPVALLEWATKPFKKYHKQSRQTHQLGSTMSGSDVALSIPLLSKDNACLIAGERTFYFSWRGGEAPYQVRIYREGSPILEQKNIQENRLKQEGMLFTEGLYRVEVQDSEHEPITGTFQVVPTTELPKLPTEFGESLHQSALGDDAKNTLFALWLIEKQKGGWEFEAYQLVAPLAKDYYPALLVQEQLELK